MLSKEKLGPNNDLTSEVIVRRNIIIITIITNLFNVG